MSSQFLRKYLDILNEQSSESSDQEKSINVVESIEPFIAPLTRILSNPETKTRFLELVKEVSSPFDEELNVEKDDDQQTVLVDKAKGTKTVIDKKNPNAPQLSQDDKGSFTLKTEKPGVAPKKLPIPPGTKVQVQQN
jgi:hypothetical protein